MQANQGSTKSTSANNQAQSTMQCFFKPATEDEPSAAHSAYKAPQKVAEPKGNFSTPVNKRGRRKGDERNTGGETNQSREKKMAAEGLHFVDTTPQRTAASFANIWPAGKDGLLAGRLSCFLDICHCTRVLRNKSA